MAVTSSGMQEVSTTADAAQPRLAIRRLDAAAVARARPVLAALLREAILGNASVGFVLPVGEPEIDAHWRGVEADVAAGTRFMLAAFVGPDLVGSVQWVPSGKANQPHRADVQKLLVLPASRGQGIGGQLMRELEADAAHAGRLLLVLDTRTDSVAERCYRRWGWTAIGVIPGYALDPDRAPAACTFFYKQLGGSTP